MLEIDEVLEARGLTFLMPECEPVIDEVLLAKGLTLLVARCPLWKGISMGASRDMLIELARGVRCVLMAVGARVCLAGVALLPMIFVR
jgi:hypothetical protein